MISCSEIRQRISNAAGVLIDERCENVSLVVLGSLGPTCEMMLPPGTAGGVLPPCWSCDSELSSHATFHHISRQVFLCRA